MNAYRTPVVPCIQDTTEFDFHGQEAQGLRPLNYEVRRGMHLRPTYAVPPARDPLGVLDAWMWAREKRDKDGVRPGQNLLTKKKMPATPPTLNEVGGFLGRKSDGVSGVKTIWRGLSQVHAAAEHYAHFAMDLADLCITTCLEPAKALHTMLVRRTVRGAITA